MTNVGRTFEKKYLEVVKHLSLIMDPYHSESEGGHETLTSVALSHEGLKYWHKIPLHLVMTDH